MNTFTMYPFPVFVKRTAAVACLLACSSPLLWAQQEGAPQPGPAASGGLLLWVLQGTAFVLGLVIIAMALLLRTSVQLRHGLGKQKNDPAASRTPMRALPLILLLAGMAASHSGMAQDAAATRGLAYDGMHPAVFYTLSGIIIVLLALIGLLYRAIMMVLKPSTAKAKTPVRLLEKLNASVPLAQEQDVLLDHDYDGIRELDNNLPPWWIYGFYATILFACIYLWRFHAGGSGKLQLAEYEEQLSTAEAELAAYRERAGNLVDEHSVIRLTDQASIAKGKSAFTASCSPCHGQLGEGGVGPNLTDPYWLHGGGVKDIFRTIKYGWPQKGMKAWEKDLAPRQIQELASYILTLQGTNPPHAKEKQGEPYIEETAPPADTAAIAQQGGSARATASR